MNTIFLLIISTLFICTYFLLKKIFDRLYFFERHYFAFDKEFIERAHKACEVAKEKFMTMQELVNDYKNPMNDKEKEEFNKYLVAKTDYELERDRYYLILELNIGVLSGKIKFNDAHEKYDGALFDFSIRDSKERKNKEIMEQIKLIKN